MACRGRLRPDGQGRAGVYRLRRRDGRADEDSLARCRASFATPPPGGDGSRAHRRAGSLMFDPALLPPALAAAGDVFARARRGGGAERRPPPRATAVRRLAAEPLSRQGAPARSVNAIADGRLPLQAKIDFCGSSTRGPACLACSASRRSAGRQHSTSARAQGFVAEDESRVMTLTLGAALLPPRLPLHEIGIDEFAQRRESCAVRRRSRWRRTPRGWPRRRRCSGRGGWR